MSLMTLFLAVQLALGVSGQRPWMNVADPPEVRAKKLLDEMTTDEKLQLFHGSCKGYTGNVCGIDRLGIPQQKNNDGPQGFRDNGHAGTSTAWPSGLTVAASFDVENMEAFGAGMGDEFYRKGANIQLGPGVCIARVPQNGRNFEYVSGEDPFLGFHMAKAVVTGIQGQGVVANVKHFVNNNQETLRGRITESVDERTQFEIYYPPFEGAIAANVGSAMCSYNKVCLDCDPGQIGNWSCENSDSLKRDLKERLGFKGWVMSDWGATHSPSIDRGLDQEMPGTNWMADKLAAKVKSGEVSMAMVDDSAFRILWPLFMVGAFDKVNNNTEANNVTTAEHRQLARKLSAESTVLLKNSGILPLTGCQNIAVIGKEAMQPNTAGGGSGHVVSSNVASPLESIRSRCTSVQYSDGEDIEAASKLAANADIAVVFVATSSHEGADRVNLSLWGQDDHLIAELAKSAGSKVVVVASTPGAILSPWRDDVAAFLMPFMPGQEYGAAIVDVLFGDVNPGAKLPITFPNQENESLRTVEQWPGVEGVAVYAEKLHVGYRFYDHWGVEPAYPFGHGLSYTSFAYSNLTIVGRKVSCEVKNVGKVRGSEVVQLYLRFPAAAEEPPKQLKGFKKLSIDAGASATAEFLLDDRSLSVWDVDVHKWTVVSGNFGVLLGSSSRDIRLTGHLASEQLEIVV